MNDHSLGSDLLPVTDNLHLYRKKITLQEAGFGYQDVIHLENLSDTQILDRLEGGRRYLQRNKVEDITLYMHMLADLLEEELTVT